MWVGDAVAVTVVVAVAVITAEESVKKGGMMREEVRESVATYKVWLGKTFEHLDLRTETFPR